MRLDISHSSWWAYVFLQWVPANTRWIVVLQTAAALLAWPSVPTVVFVAGASASAVFAKLLKAIIRAPRPAGSRQTDAGFPSSHALVLWYYATQLCILVALDGHLQRDQQHVTGAADLQDGSGGLMLGWSAVTRTIVCGVLLALAGLLSAWRVFAQLHTVDQAVGGTLFGIAFAAGWHTVGAPWLAPYVAAWLTTRPLVKAGGIAFFIIALFTAEHFKPLDVTPQAGNTKSAAKHR